MLHGPAPHAHREFPHTDSVSAASQGALACTWHGLVLRGHVLTCLLFSPSLPCPAADPGCEEEAGGSVASVIQPCLGTEC